MGLAAIAQAEGNRTELICTLEILRSFLEDSECAHINYLVNEKFVNDSFSINTQVDFDHENKRTRPAKSTRRNSVSS